MQAYIDQLIQDGAFAGMPREVVYAIAMVLAAFVVLSVFVAPLAGVTSWLERRVWARMQSRVGPNRVGPAGLLQPVADGIKLLFKEIILPANANKALFVLAPVVMIIPALAAWAVIPFSPELVLSDINAGLLYIMALSSIGVYGVIIAGWASNSKYAFLGAMRSAAQMVSYELAMGFALVVVLMVSGSLNLSDIVNGQGRGTFADKGLKNEPKRCKPCKQRKNERIAANMQAYGTAFPRERVEVSVRCALCAVETTVPFRPTQGRPVYCRDCFLKMRASVTHSAASMP